MTWSPVVVGVDASREGALAAATAWSIARAAGAEYRLVHVAREMAKVPAVVAQAPGGAEVAQRLAAGARRRVEEVLRGNAPPEVVDHLEICAGNPAWILRRVAEEYEAGLLVLGGKRHTAPVRWFGGSTVHHAVRTIDVPILVTACPRPQIARILVAIDLSHAGKPTLETALRFASVFSAQIRAMHVVESFPPIPDVAIQIDEQEYFRLAGEEFTELVASATETDARGNGHPPWGSCAHHRGGSRGLGGGCGGRGITRQGVGRPGLARQRNGTAAQPPANLGPGDSDACTSCGEVSPPPGRILRLANLYVQTRPGPCPPSYFLYHVTSQSG